jgi:hypothetical protein
VRTKAVSGELGPSGGDAGSTSAAFGRRGMRRKRGGRLADRGVRGDSATASREAGSEVKLAFAFKFALGVGKRRAGSHQELNGANSTVGEE